MDQHSFDYTSWSNEDLIKRVSDLEAQLRAHNIEHSKTGPPGSSTVPFKKKPRKPAKAFDPSRYTTRSIALKFAYLGGRYNGYEHHTNNTTPLPTVEEVLWKALRKTRLILPHFRDGQSEDDVCWDGCEYSKCGRTDRGVSAFGQVIGLRVRSARPKHKQHINGAVETIAGSTETGQIANLSINGGSPKTDDDESLHTEPAPEPIWDSVKDELPYIQLLNRVLPSDIRVLAWCPDPPPDFSARFNCKERRYRYFFTNPAYLPMPAASDADEAWLDVQSMQKAAKRLEGLHDFSNFCKVDPSKQITNFERRIFHASIEPVLPDQEAGAFLDRKPFGDKLTSSRVQATRKPELYYFEVRGSAFLWHQVRHMVAVLFLVGQGYEQPSIVDDLLDVQKTPARPFYGMASDVPLVLWDCMFPESDHHSNSLSGNEDGIDWIYVGDEGNAAAGPTRYAHGIEDRKYGRLGIMEDLWAMWRKRKMDELLAGSLMDVVARQGREILDLPMPERLKTGEVSARIFDGSETPKNVGKYVPVMQRERMEAPEVVNARYAARKGLNDGRTINGDADMDE